MPSASSTPSTTPTTRRAPCGRRWPVSVTIASSAWETRTTSGPWATRAPAGPAAKSTSTRATTSPAPRSLPGGPVRVPPATATAGSRSGTWSSCSSSSGPARSAAPSPARRSTPGWGWSGCAPSCKAFVPTTRPICCGRWSIAPAPCPARRSCPTTISGPSVSLRAIADHARASTFLIADGVFPEKTGREYVRAADHATGGLPRVVAGDSRAVHGRPGRRRHRHACRREYPELSERRGVILEVSEQEERRFRETLDRGLRILDQEMEGGAQAASRAPSPSSCTTPSGSRWI